MKRIVTVVVVALVMAAMMLAMAMPVFAQGVQFCPPGSHPVGPPVAPGGGSPSFACVPNPGPPG